MIESAVYNETMPGIVRMLGGEWRGSLILAFSATLFILMLMVIALMALRVRSKGIKRVRALLEGKDDL